MKKLILLPLLMIGCSTQGYNQRLDSGVSGAINVLIRNAASAAQGGTFDTRRVINETIYVGSTEIQSQVYDDYYERIREQHRRDAIEREYQIWAEKEDRKNGIDREAEFRKRYYGK